MTDDFDLDLEEIRLDVSRIDEGDEPNATAPVYEPHPIANCWPATEGAALDAIRASMLELGLLHPIWLYEGKVLDGRTRNRLCSETGIPPRFMQYEGDDPVGFARSSNETRRQLTESQRAMVAARLATLVKGLRSDASRDASATTQANAAELMNVGRAQVQRARVVQERAVPEVVALVDSGRIPVATAARLTKETPEHQKAIAALVAAGPKPDVAIAVRVVKGADGGAKDAPKRRESAKTVHEIVEAAAALALEDQERVLHRIQAFVTTGRKLQAALAEAEKKARFQAALDQANARSKAAPRS